LYYIAAPDIPETQLPAVLFVLIAPPIVKVPFIVVFENVGVVVVLLVELTLTLAQ
jgi:hypothetical protein